MLARFGEFELNLTSETLWRKGSRVRIQQQPYRLLVSLLDRPGEIVTREALRRKLWADAPGADLDRSLNTALRKVRRALQDSPTQPRYVETVRGRGYRLLVPVEKTETSASPSAWIQVQHSRRRARWMGLRGLGLAVLALAALASFCRVADRGTEPARLPSPSAGKSQVSAGGLAWASGESFP
jgi:DNA-binding winged helix-turn-helix (wHTH) protein